MGQLPLDLGFAPRYGADDFLVSPSNAAAYELLARWPAWPSRTLLLIGPEGSGKSHLAAMWAERSQARTLVGPEFVQMPVVAAGALVIEDADEIHGAEVALFHTLNGIREHGGYLLMTAKAPADRWGLGTKDLVSRLRLAPLLGLDAPDDALLRAVLVKLFLDRQLIVDTAVVDYLTLRIDRSLGAARRLVDAIDRASLADQRRITRPIAAKVLGSLVR